MTGAATARARLAADQLLRPQRERRVALEVLSQRLDRAGRDALMQLLAGRAQADRRFLPVLQTLIRTSELVRGA